MVTYSSQIASQLNLRTHQVAATIELLDGGNTIPFIARYRKEVTGTLDEEQLRSISDLLEKLRTLDKRRETIITTIEKQGQLTAELHEQLLAAETLTELEDLYQPYKRKRRTRATIAREKGLEGLAKLIVEQNPNAKSLEKLAKGFLNDQVPTVQEALAGARDIVAEMMSDHADVRRVTREKALKWSKIQCGKIEAALDSEEEPDPRGVFKDYYEFEFRVNGIRPHQILAINRGEAQKILRVKVPIGQGDWRSAVNPVFPQNRRSGLAKQLDMALQDGAKRLLLPTIERDVRRTLTEEAEEHAIGVFATNLRNLLNQPPLNGYVVMGIDPAYRTGCKVAVVDPTGKVMDIATIYPHPPRKRKAQALEKLTQLIEWYGVTVIAIGNGTASRETEQLVAELTRSMSYCQYLIVSEAGASVYSASKLARAELPDLDVTIRGAVSIARRVQDPLAELVKIDPKSIGVGMYQHDVDQNQLAKSLDGVVESVVNQVGVEVNTASPALLTYVSGIGPKLSERIIAYREEHGPFTNRKTLKKVSGLGPKTFEQAVGFLRIRDGDNPLDASAIHPESYKVAKALLKRAGVTMKQSVRERERALNRLPSQQPLSELATELGTGVPTLTDIFEQLIRPGRDPREELPAPILRSDILTMRDLKPGMRLKGTVRNVVDFGAFVDIGVKQDGLLHRSKLPYNVMLSVGDVIEVVILKVEIQRGRIGLGWPGYDGQRRQYRR
ncbi:MAG: Tex family protein [Ardenticatenaceae bacterium]